MQTFTKIILSLCLIVLSTTSTVTGSYTINGCSVGEPSSDTSRIELPTNLNVTTTSNYIQLYYVMAQTEQILYGIPSSITLAQGLLESNTGNSKLAKLYNNHFGIKCFSRTCSASHCVNVPDDHHKDFFRVYNTPSESFRSHSLFLKNDRYSELFNYESNDYTAWAFGLKVKGYATDEKYAEKLIKIIEDNQLQQYDL